MQVERYREVHRRYWLDAPVRDERKVEPLAEAVVQ
jgi:hypothetical protein